MERVSVRRGKNPLLFVAPHGPDDSNTDIIAEQAAESCDGYYVINRGFERKGDIVDVDNDRANCNRIDHVVQEVVKEEFLDPITKFAEQMKNKIWSGSGQYYVDPTQICKPVIFYVHGAGDHVHSQVGEDVSIIIGYGLSHKNESLSCEEWRRKLFVHSYRSMTVDGEVYEGQGGGNYGGRSANNMNQYFRKHDSDMLIDSMQLEFPYSTRSTESIATMTGVLLATVAQDILNHDPSNPLSINPKQKFI